MVVISPGRVRGMAGGVTARVVHYIPLRLYLLGAGAPGTAAPKPGSATAVALTAAQPRQGSPFLLLQVIQAGAGGRARAAAVRWRRWTEPGDSRHLRSGAKGAAGGRQPRAGAAVVSRLGGALRPGPRARTARGSATPGATGCASARGAASDVGGPRAPPGRCSRGPLPSDRDAPALPRPSRAARALCACVGHLVGTRRPGPVRSDAVQGRGAVRALGAAALHCA